MTDSKGAKYSESKKEVLNLVHSEGHCDLPLEIQKVIHGGVFVRVEEKRELPEEWGVMTLALR